MAGPGVRSRGQPEVGIGGGGPALPALSTGCAFHPASLGGGSDPFHLQTLLCLSGDGVKPVDSWLPAGPPPWGSEEDLRGGHCGQEDLGVRTKD